MADLATLQVRLEANGAVSEARRLSTELDKMGVAGRKVEGGMKDVSVQVRNTTGSFSELRRLLAAGFAAQAAREYVVLTDKFNMLQGRIKLVTKSQQEMDAVQERLRRSARETRNSYETTVQLYSRTAMAAEQLGLSQARLTKFVELTNMAVKASGATSSESAGALIQLSQGLAANQLRGQELISVMEQIPAVARAIQQGLGLTQGEFRQMALEGRISAIEVIRAVERMETKIRKDFATAPKTMGEAFVMAKDEIMFALGEIDKATDGSSNISKNIVRLTDYFIKFGKAVIVASEAGGSLLGLYGHIGAPGPYTRQLLEGLTRPQGGGALSNQGIANYLGAIPGMGQIAQYMGASSAIAGLGPGESAKEKTGIDPYKKALEDFNEEFLRWEQKGFADRIESLTDELDAKKAFEEEFRRWQQQAFSDSLDRLLEIKEMKEREAAERIDRALAKQIGDDFKKFKKDVLDPFAESEQIARNFQDNIQRSLGDFFTEFVRTGRVSIQSLFQGISGVGANIAGQGISRLITEMLPKSMGPLGSILSGLGLAGIGSLFGRRNRPSGPTAEERLAAAQGRYASIEMLRQQRAEEMRQFMEGRNGAASRGVVQSIGTVLQETTASRMIGELVAIRVATRQTADAVRGGGSAAMGGTTVNVTVQGGAMATGQEIGEKVAEAVDRLLGTKVQALRLNSGAAVVQ